jgi:hypothetical protein
MTYNWSFTNSLKAFYYAAAVMALVVTPAVRVEVVLVYGFWAADWLTPRKDPVLLLPELVLWLTKLVLMFAVFFGLVMATFAALFSVVLTI